MEKIVIPSNQQQIDLTIDLVDGYIIGIKDLCVNVGYQVDIDELDNLMTKLEHKKVFVALNKNMENKDLAKLKSVLRNLNKYGINAILYSDVCFVRLKDSLNLNYHLIWSHEHLTTNYDSINYWSSLGVYGTYVSSDITLSELIEISNKTNTILMVNIFGYLPMFVSKRHIVKNYLNKFDLDDNSNIYYMEKEDKTYPIIDNDVGTMVYSDTILNGINEYYTLLDNKIDYVVFNGFEIDNQLFREILVLIKDMTKNTVNDVYEKINKLIPNTSSGFMYQDTISKVKNNE